MSRFYVTSKSKLKKFNDGHFKT